MKLNKKLILMLIMALIVLPIIFSNISNASETKIFGIKGLRTVHDYSSSSNYFSGPFTYRSAQSDTKIAIPYHIGEKTSAGYVWNQAIYCLNEGHGFRDDADSTLIVERTYNVSYDMKKPSEIPQQYKNPWGTDPAKYNSILWILDNMYVPEHEDEEERQTMKETLLQAAFAEQLSNGEISSIDDIYLTDDDIEAVQQMAIWHFTDQTLFNAIWISPQEVVVNNKLQLEGFNPMTELDEELPGGADENPYITEEGWYRDDDMRTLYNYLVSEAGKNNTYQGEMKIEFIDRNPVAVKTQVGSNYIIGPFKIEKTGNDASYTFEATVVDQDNNPITNYTVVNQSGSSITGIRTIQDAIGKGDFYLSVPRNVFTKAEDKSIKINMKAQYDATQATLWTNSETYEQEQPVVVVEKILDTVEYEEIIELQDDYFDLALRKYIIAVNGVAVTDSRQPNIVTSGLIAGGNITTATYKHRKDPVRVDTGDIVTYRITVYNEGNVDGRATQIIDQLPEGLEFLEGVTTGYTYEKLSDNKIKITKTRTENLPAFTGTGNLSSETIEFKCSVTAIKTENQQILTNVAWISEAVNDLGIIDRDSQPENHPELDDSELPNYKGNNDNKQELTDSEYHYKGQQDDDDFEKLILPEDIKEFDLALRKYIVAVNGVAVTDSRQPNIVTTGLIAGGNITTATYKHRKDPVRVNTGDIVTYRITVYNEGNVDGRATEIIDQLPEGVEFLEGVTTGYTYEKLSDNKIKITKTGTENLSGFTGKGNLSSETIEFKCSVTAIKTEQEQILTNVAWISEAINDLGIIDRDSQPENYPELDNTDLPDYKGNNDNKQDLTDSEYHYKGQQDEDDFEKLILPKDVKEFDLALQKFITKVGTKEIYDREPVFSISSTGQMSYESVDTPLLVSYGDLIEYTIRIYNEGDLAGYADLIQDDIPEGLEFVVDNETNIEYRWKLSSNGESVTSDYLSFQRDEDNILMPFDEQSMKEPEYKDVKIVFKVIESQGSLRVIVNTAEIADDSDENGNEIDDVDSTPNNWDNNEDDLDKEYIRLQYFDLALKKFITKVNDIEIVNREPIFEIDAEGKITYKTNKTPVEVENQDIIIYTIRVYNEGNISGYAQEITDDVPDGLEFLPDHEINTQYQWELSEDGTKVSTKYLSKESNEQNIINYFNKEAMTGPNYKDVQIAFKVKEPSSQDRTIINTAEITDDYNEFDIPDIDSEPDNWDEDEDDLDKEYIKVKYFDLSLIKYIKTVTVIEDGNTVTTETGFTGPDEDLIKIEINRKKIDKTTVKIAYTIKVTNEGEIGGYATEITDYIPEGLEFVQEDNPNWTMNEDGTASTNMLRETYLNPGDSATVEIILRWKKDANNLGEKDNSAEITEDYNDSGTPDIDSTPDNNIPEEDDQDNAPIIFSIKTGTAPTYFVLTLSTLTLVTAGVALIKKYVI